MSEYDNGFDAGILHQCMQERDEDARRELKHRAAAFGAIRRAAEVARAMDEKAEKLPIDLAYECDDIAKGARAAIRAAIGSDKA